MTTQQVKRLCAVDPNHFGIMMGGLWFDRHGKDWVCKGKAVWSHDLPHVEAESLGVALWWMLSQLPNGTILCWEDKQNKFACYVRTKEGRDFNSYGVRGCGIEFGHFTSKDGKHAYSYSGYESFVTGFDTEQDAFDHASQYAYETAADRACDIDEVL